MPGPYMCGCAVGGGVPNAPRTAMESAPAKPAALFFNALFLFPHTVPKAAQFPPQRKIIAVAVDD